VQEGFVFLGERHLKTTLAQMPVFASFIEALEALGIGAMVLQREVTEAELRKFAELFVAATGMDDLRERLAGANIESIALEPPRTIRKQESVEGGIRRGEAAQSAGSDHGQVRRRARGAYARMGAALAALNQSARGGGTIHFRQAKRAIQNIADLLLKDPDTVLALTTLRSHDQYTQNHSVNVALLSMALGNRVGYSKVELADVGLAALFHDLGKCAVPIDVLNKPGNFSEQEWAVMQTHPSQGVLALLDSRGLPRLPARMAAACFEHHLAFDGSGYPKLTRPWKQALASKVIAVADCYDAMTSARVYRREPFAPPDALRFMLSRAGTLFEPTLLKYFVTCIGIIPIGTLVLLDTGELAVVLRPASDKENPDRPMVRVIADAAGARLDPPRDHDLRETADGGGYARSIARLLDNTEHRLETSRWVAATP
jgi:HD-GYP domain-containing protein (c-di-GMP phosphodiesterase class II)